MPSPPSTPPLTGAAVLAPFTLLAAAAIWGLVWYPYRLLDLAGLHGSVSSLLTYALGVPPLLVLAWRGAWPGGRQAAWLAGVALSAGWTNLSYVLAVLDGEVMRVMLLFYLAPLWTVLLARLILRERAGRAGLAVIGLSLAGAAGMLQRGRSPPLPANPAEWLGLSSGIGFALTNVLTRRLRDIPLQTRSLWVFLGVTLVAAGFAVAQAAPVAPVTTLGATEWLVLGGITLALLLATFTVQYGVAHVAANRAVVILLFELVVAALSSHWLAGEAMTPREWIGGAMIVAATLFSIRLKHDHG